MPKVNFQTIPIEFRSEPDSDGQIAGSGSVTFPTNVISADASIAEFQIGFGNDNDHHIRTFGAQVFNVQSNGTVVTVDGTMKLIDKSGNKISLQSAILKATVMAWCE